MAFALRRIGCCPPAAIPKVAETIIRTGSTTMTMPGGVPCNIRLVVFAGRNPQGEGRPGYLAIDLRHVITFITQRLRQYDDVLRGTQFKDYPLSLLMLQHKLGQDGRLA